MTRVLRRGGKCHRKTRGENTTRRQTQRPEPCRCKPRTPRIPSRRQKLGRGKEGCHPESQREPALPTPRRWAPPSRTVREFHVCCWKPRSWRHSAALGKESSQRGPHPVLRSLPSSDLPLFWVICVVIKKTSCQIRNLRGHFDSLPLPPAHPHANPSSAPSCQLDPLSLHQSPSWLTRGRLQ